MLEPDNLQSIEIDGALDVVTIKVADRVSGAALSYELPINKDSELAFKIKDLFETLQHRVENIESAVPPSEPCSTCWTSRCCYGTDVWLTPEDVEKLCDEFGVDQKGLVDEGYIVLDQHWSGKYIARLDWNEDESCVFLNNEYKDDTQTRCSIYDSALPSACAKSNEKLCRVWESKELYQIRVRV